MTDQKKTKRDEMMENTIRIYTTLIQGKVNKQIKDKVKQKNILRVSSRLRDIVEEVERSFMF